MFKGKFNKFVALFMSMVISFNLLPINGFSIKVHATGIPDTTAHNQNLVEANEEGKIEKQSQGRTDLFQYNVFSSKTLPISLENSGQEPYTLTSDNNWCLAHEYDKLDYNTFHIMVQNDITNRYNNDIKKELYLKYNKPDPNPEYKNGKETGSADLWKLIDDYTYYLWEVKPYSYSNVNRAKGEKQLNEYIYREKVQVRNETDLDKIKLMSFRQGETDGVNIDDGDLFFFVFVVTPKCEMGFVEKVRYDVHYEAYENGLVIYTFRRTFIGREPLKQGGEVPVPVPNPDPVPDSENAPGYESNFGSNAYNTASDDVETKTKDLSNNTRAQLDRTGKISFDQLTFIMALCGTIYAVNELYLYNPHWSTTVNVAIKQLCTKLMSKAGKVLGVIGAAAGTGAAIGSTAFATEIYDPETIEAVYEFIDGISLLIDEDLAKELRNAVNEGDVDKIAELTKEIQNEAENYAKAGDAQPPRDPLIIDLGKTGIELHSLANGVNFDLDNNGFAEKTAWVGSEDGLLALDRNENGKIDNGGELFGDQVIMKNGFKSESGFEALAELDENGDGIIDKNDPQFANLCVWIDANRNGISEANELNSLDAIGVTAISLAHTEISFIDEETGSRIAESSSVTINRNGINNTTEISEFWFPVNSSDTMQGGVVTAGNVPNIIRAINEDESGVLFELCFNFSKSNDIALKHYYLKQILYFITDAKDVPINSRGGNIDARDLKVVEQFMGREFIGVDGSNPNVNAAEILKSIYIRIEDQYFNILNMYSSLGGYLHAVYEYDNDMGTKSLNITFLNSIFDEKIADGDDIDSLVYDLGVYLGSFDSTNDTNHFDEYSSHYSAISQHYAEIVELARTGFTYLGTPSADSYSGTNNNDFIFGEEGNDTLHGGNGMDGIFGGDGNDVMHGESDEDYLNGGIGNDTLYGGADNDILYGDDGSDILDGGTGDDILYGGESDDTYIFAKGYGNDTIIDADGLNTLRFKGLNPSDILVNGTGEFDAAITVKGTNDTLVIKDFRKGGEYANYDLEFDGIKMHITDNDSPFRHIYGDSGDDVLRAVVDDSIMHAFGGNDTVYGSDGNDMIYGNEGDDAIFAGSGNDVVYGGDGDDILDGGMGNDFLYGGYGNDTYVFGRNCGTDIISDSEGISTIKIAEGITLDDLDIITVGENVIIALKDSEDKLIINGFAGNADNYFLEFGGESVLLKDSITADENEFLSGSEESDYLVNENSSVIAGGTGDDRIIGNDEDEIVLGDSGNDQMLAGVGNDVVFGGSGDDYINGGAGNDVMDGGSGNDFIDGGAGDDIYFFNPGCGNDSIKDGDGANTIVFGDGITASGIKAYRSNWNDLLITFDGFDDTLTIKNYCIDEGARNFLLVFADGTVVEAAAQDSPLRKIYGTDGSEYMESIYDDGIINDAQESNDQIVGSDSSDMLYGGDGDERITGKAGDDILDGGKGNDYLSGGAGNDAYIFNKGYGVDTISDGEGTNTINIYGYSANQIKAYRTNWNDITLTFDDSEDKIVIEGFFASEANRDFYLTFNGGGRVHATASNSPLRSIYGTDGDDYMSAMDDRGTTLYGEIGADNLNGGDGADRLYGGIGNDQLYGNGGNDTLDGGEGNDMLYGGAENDTYIFNVGSGTDTIIDGEGINIISFGAGLLQNAMTAYRHNWNDLMIVFEGVEDTLIIRGYFDSESNRNFEVRFADGTRYAYDDAENPIKQVHAAEYDDWMTAWSDNGIVLHGDGGNDNLTGGAGDDMLFGGIGNDTLNGNDGDDILDGGEGSDFLYGGLDNDTYRFGIGYGSDIIEDNDGDNKVELIGIDSDAVSFEMTDSGELVITVAESGDVLTIRNFDSERFTFEFADEVSGMFNVETGEFERILSEEELVAIEAVNTENESVQANADILDEIYAESNPVSELFTENDNAVVSGTDNSAS